MPITVGGSTITFNDSTTQSTAAGPIYPGTRGQVFTASGTFTVPASITTIKVQVLGGGGGGNNDPYGVVIAGGSGGYVIEYLNGLTPGATVAVTVGAGGAVGGTGGTSSFGDYCSATGGGINSPGLGSGGNYNQRGGYPTGSLGAGSALAPSPGGNPGFANSGCGGGFTTAGGSGVVILEW